MISTRDLSGLPDIDALKRLMQSMAMLDAILCPEWEFRYYSFNSKWGKGKQMGSSRSGSGDDLFALFNTHGCFLKGFDHESAMTPYARHPKEVWEGVFTGVPKEFASCLKEPAFTMEDTTFCIWRRYGDSSWQHGKIKFPKGGNDPDGSSYLLLHYDANPKTYLDWAKDYFDETAEPLTLAHVRHVYAHEPLTRKLVREINPDVTLISLAADIDEIGYPRK